jgi:uncharacterized protein with PQ loop repeat
VNTNGGGAGVVRTALSCLVSVPQAIRVLRAERLDGISASTYVIVLSNAAIWAAWSVLTREYAAGIPGLINGPAAILVLHRLMIAHRGGASRSQMAACSGTRPATRSGIYGSRLAYSRAMWLDEASNTMTLKPTVKVRGERDHFRVHRQ